MGDEGAWAGDLAEAGRQPLIPNPSSPIPHFLRHRLAFSRMSASTSRYFHGSPNCVGQ